ncbi:hypothetical protein MMC18_003905 [Xylographa bjoerkii]|nr:hypothetical protein [Xylographa bjoerkii]
MSDNPVNPDIPFSNPARQPARAVAKHNNMIRLCDLHFENIETTPRNSWMRSRLTKWWGRAEVPEYLVAQYPGLISNPGQSNRQRTDTLIVPHRELPSLKEETTTPMQTLDSLIATIKAAPVAKVEPNSEDEITEVTKRSKMGRDSRNQRYSPRERTSGYVGLRGPEMGSNRRQERHSPGSRTAGYKELRRPPVDRNADNNERWPSHETSEHNRADHASGRVVAQDGHTGSPSDHSRGRGTAHHADNAGALSTPSGAADLQIAFSSLTQATATFAPARPDISALISAASIQVASIMQSVSSIVSTDEPSYRTSREGRSLERGSGFRRKRDEREHECET